MGTEPAAAGRRVILLAGPSGSGKSTLVRDAGLPMVYLDDFYRAGHDPGLPRHPDLGIVDWDHPDSWDAESALAALEQLCLHGVAQLPVYDLAANSPTGTRTVHVGARAFVAEGIFAPELVAQLQRKGLLLDAIVVRRDRWKNLVRRLARDLKERRKPPATLLRRGAHLYHVEPQLVARAVAAGCRPLDARAVRAALRAHARADDTGRSRGRDRA